MDIKLSKSFILSMIAAILVLMQSRTSNIIIDAALVFIGLGLAKINKDKNRKFDYYAWSVLFVVFFAIFILKAFILV